MNSSFVLANIYLEPNWKEQKKLMMLDQGRVCILTRDGFKCQGKAKVGDYLPSNIRFENPMQVSYKRDKDDSYFSHNAIKICVLDNYILRCFSDLKDNIELPLPEFKDKVYKIEMNTNGSDICALSGDSLFCWDWYLVQGNSFKNISPHYKIVDNIHVYNEVMNFQTFNRRIQIYNKDGTVLKSQNKNWDISWFPLEFLQVEMDFQENDIISRSFAYDSSCSYDLFNQVNCLTKNQLKNIPQFEEPILELATEYPKYCARTFSKIVCWDIFEDKMLEIGDYDTDISEKTLKFVEKPFVYKFCQPFDNEYIECQNSIGGIEKILHEDWKEPKICYHSGGPEATCLKYENEVVKIDQNILGSNEQSREETSCEVVNKKFSCPKNLKLESYVNSYFRTNIKSAKNIFNTLYSNGMFCVVEVRDFFSKSKFYPAFDHWLSCIPDSKFEIKFQSMGPIFPNNKVLHLVNTYDEKLIYFIKLIGDQFLLTKTSDRYEIVVTSERNSKLETFINNNADVFIKYFNDLIKIEKVFFKNDEYCFYFNNKELVCSLPFLKNIKTVDDILFATYPDHGQICVVEMKNKVSCWSWTPDDSNRKLIRYQKINYFPNDVLNLSNVPSGKSFNLRIESLKPLIESSNPIYAGYYQDLFNYYDLKTSDFQDYFGSLLILSAIESAISENTSKLYFDKFKPEFMIEYNKVKHLLRYSKFFSSNDLRVIFRIILITIKSAQSILPINESEFLNELRLLAVQAYQNPNQSNIINFIATYNLVEVQLQILEQNNRSYFLYKNFLIYKDQLQAYLSLNEPQL